MVAVSFQCLCPRATIGESGLNGAESSLNPLDLVTVYTRSLYFGSNFFSPQRREILGIFERLGFPSIGGQGAYR